MEGASDWATGARAGRGEAMDGAVSCSSCTIAGGKRAEGASLGSTGAIRRREEEAYDEVRMVGE